MDDFSPPQSLITRVLRVIRDPILLKKVFSFGVIGVANALVDLGVFLLALRYVTSSLVIANVIAWMVAVSGSYVLNSVFTFAAESGRVLRWRDYVTFAASGILGVIANTTVVVIAAEWLLLPVVVAKILAIGAGFLVNFSMSHFVVFRKRHTDAV
jgi:putative flippase GtrA